MFVISGMEDYLMIYHVICQNKAGVITKVLPIQSKYISYDCSKRHSGVFKKSCIFDNSV